MSELLALGSEVLQVLLVRADLQRHAFDDLEPVALETRALGRVVRHQPHLADAQVHQDLGADPEVPQVGREAEALVGLDRVEPLVVMLLELSFRNVGDEDINI